MLQEFDFQHFIQNVFTYITGNPKVLSILISLIFLFILYVIIKKFIRKLSSVVKYYFYSSIGLSSVNILTTILSYFTITLPFGISSILLNSGSLITLLIGLWKMKKELEQLGI
jgi:hypothetical protein